MIGGCCLFAIPAGGIIGTHRRMGSNERLSSMFRLGKKAALIVTSFFATVLLLTLSLASCSRNTTDTQSTQPQKASRTVLMYACGTEQPIKAESIAATLNQTMDSPIPEDVNVLVLTGGSDQWPSSLYVSDKDEMNTDCYQVWKMSGSSDAGHGVLSAVAPNGIRGSERTSMDNPAMLRAFLDYASDNYPAQAYDLVMLGVGGGPSLGMGTDMIAQREDGMLMMSIPEMCTALHDSKVERLEVLGLCAGLMGSVEVATALSPYASNIVFCPQTLPRYGQVFTGMFDLLASDSQTDGFLLGKRIADDSASNGVASVVSTKNLTERLVPELAKCSDALCRRALQRNDKGTFDFDGVILAANQTTSYGSAYEPEAQLYDLKSFANALLANAPANVGSAGNASAEVLQLVVSILDDHDLSGDDVLYCSAFNNKDADGTDSAPSNDAGIGIFFDTKGSVYGADYLQAMGDVVALGDIDEGSGRFLGTHRNAVALFDLIGSSGKAVFAISGANEKTYNVAGLKKAWDSLGLWQLPPLNRGLKDVYDTAKVLNSDTDKWLEDIAQQQSKTVLTKDCVEIRQRESNEEKGSYDRYFVAVRGLAPSDLAGIHTRVRIKADLKANGAPALEEFNSFDECYATTNPTQPDSTTYELVKYDEQCMVLKDAKGTEHLVQCLHGADPNRIEVPLAVVPAGNKEPIPVMFEFARSEDGTATPHGLIPVLMDRNRLKEGLQPLDLKMLDGTTAISALRVPVSDGCYLDYELSTGIALDSSPTRGLVLKKTAVRSVKGVQEAKGEYYLEDKYGNELALDKIVEDASKQEPLRNIAHANVELDGSDGTPVLTYDDTTLEDGMDYETVETDDGQVVFVGKGAYTGTATLG